MKNSILILALLLITTFGLSTEARAQAEAKISLPVITPYGNFADINNLRSTIGEFELEANAKLWNIVHFFTVIGHAEYDAYNDNEDIFNDGELTKYEYFYDVDHLYYHAGIMLKFDNAFGQIDNIHPYAGAFLGNSIVQNNSKRLDCCSDDFFGWENSELYFGINAGMMYDIIPKINVDARARYWFEGIFETFAFRIGFGYNFK